MKLALIPPTSLLGYTELTDYQLALPHMLDSDGRYREWYKYLAKLPGQYVILDNGEAEGENRYPAQYLLDMVGEYGFDEVIAHDVMLDREASQDKTEKFLEVAAEYYKYEDKRPKIGVVAQGRTMKEIYQTFFKFGTHPLVDVFYLPRCLVTEIDRSARVSLAFWLANSPYKQEIHCLGTNPEWIGEVSYLAGLPNVRGVDTSAPFNYAFENETDYSVPIKRPENYFEWPMQAFGDPKHAGSLVAQLVRMANAA